MQDQIRGDLLRLYVHASCIQLFKDKVAATGGSSERNNSARLINSSLTRPNTLLEPLYGQQPTYCKFPPNQRST